MRLVSHLEGVNFKKYTPEDAFKLVNFMMKYSTLWDLWQPPSRKFELVYGPFNENEPDRRGEFVQYKFKARKHFPNINFSVRQIHKILGLHKDYDSHYPLPTTPSALAKLKVYWKEMCKAINLYTDDWTEPPKKVMKQSELPVTRSPPSSPAIKRDREETPTTVTKPKKQKTLLDCGIEVYSLDMNLLNQIDFEALLA